MTPAKLIVVLVFSLVVQGFVVAIGSRVFPASSTYIDLVGQLTFALLIFACCVKTFNLQKWALEKIFGKARAIQLLQAAMLGCAILMLTFGESAIQTMALARYDADFAYGWGNFHEMAYRSHNFLSMIIGEFLVASIIIPALIEEFFFRGLLLRAFCERRSFLQSALLTSALFTAFHPSGGVYLSCFAFAMASCLLYVQTGSLYPCMVMHATYNLLAFLSQHYFDFHRTRSIDQLRSVTDWIPQITMLAVALTLLTWWIVRNKAPRTQTKTILEPLQQEP